MNLNSDDSDEKNDVNENSTLIRSISDDSKPRSSRQHVEQKVKPIRRKSSKTTRLTFAQNTLQNQLLHAVNDTRSRQIQNWSICILLVL